MALLFSTLGAAAFAGFAALLLLLSPANVLRHLFARGAKESAAAH